MTRKRKDTKKLGLQKETLRHLQADQLTQVVGGMTDGARGTTRCRVDGQDEGGI
jgi:hypothetical protein